MKLFKSVLFLLAILAVMQLTAVNTTIKVINETSNEIGVHIYPIGVCRNIKESIAASNTKSWTIGGCDTKMSIWFPGDWYTPVTTSLTQSECTIIAKGTSDKGYYVEVEKKDPTPWILGAGTVTDTYKVEARK